jgi:hypothetical protein
LEIASSALVELGTAGQLHAAGFSTARVALDWADIERSAGVYTWNSSDLVAAALSSNDMSAVWMLNVTNPLYCNGSAPDQAPCVSAFVAFAQAAFARYGGTGALWSVSSEPNTNGWPPKANVSAYLTLVAAVGDMVNSQFPNETLIGPSLGQIDGRLDSVFLLGCLDGGVLDYFRAIDIHPFSAGPPELAIDEYFMLRNMLDAASPAQFVPIVTTGWGYSTAETGASSTGVDPPLANATTQAKYVPRMWFVDLGCGVNLTTYYQAIDASDNVTLLSDGYGLLHHDYDNATQPHSPKPAFHAAAALSNLTTDCSLIGLLEISFLPEPLPLPSCFVVYLGCGPAAAEQRYAVWCMTNDSVLQGVTFDVAFNTTPPAVHRHGMSDAATGPHVPLLQERQERAGRSIPAGLRFSSVVQPQQLSSQQSVGDAASLLPGADCWRTFDYMGTPVGTACSHGVPAQFSFAASNGPLYLLR